MEREKVKEEESLGWCVHAFLADRTNGRAYATVLRPSVLCNVLL